MGNSRGFTLAELVIVMLIIAILAGIVVAKFGGGTLSAEKAKALEEMNQMHSAVKAMRLDIGFWPYGNAWNATGTNFLINKNSLALILKDDGTAGNAADLALAKVQAKTPYLDVPPAVTYMQDPWGTPYLVYYLAGNKTLWVLSKGPNTLDDVWDWNAGKPNNDNLMVFVHKF